MLRRYLALSLADRRLLREAAFRLVRAWILLRLLPFRWLTRSLQPGEAGDLAPAEIKRIRWAIEAVANRLPSQFPCLPRGFAAVWMMQARGAAPQLHYGVAHGAAGFESHVWVELRGTPVIGHREAPRFRILRSFPS